MTALSILTQHPVGVAAMLAAGDPRASRLVYAMVGGLLVVGVLLIILGVWIIRQTRQDRQVLAPLERMGDRTWFRSDPSTQRRMLDQVRPNGARPLRPEPLPPKVDLEFEQSVHSTAPFSDLGPGIDAEVDAEVDEPALAEVAVVEVDVPEVDVPEVDVAEGDAHEVDVVDESGPDHTPVGASVFDLDAETDSLAEFADTGEDDDQPAGATG